VSRYARQLVLPQVGEEGQRRLAATRVLIVGLGGLGCPAATYLVLAGVGRLRIVDPDRVELTNLHRQPLYGEADVGRPKIEAAAARLRSLNGEVEIEPVAERLDAANADSLLAGCDVAIDGTDNFEARYALAEACAGTKTPHVYGAVLGFLGHVALFAPGEGPCFRCAFPDAPEDVPNCAEAGVLGATAGVVGSRQAALVLARQLGLGGEGVLHVFDGLSGRERAIRLRRDPDCPGCGPDPRPPKQVTSCAMVPALGPAELREALASPNPPRLLDVREAHEREISVLSPDVHIPIGELPDRLGEIDPSADWVVYCRSGARSAQATRLLIARGFARVRNLQGGINGWAREVDPSLRTY
jgi:adenylyltransferase/sulfurtransferase